MNSATRTMQRQSLLSPLHTGKPDRTDSNPSAFIFCTSFTVAPPLLTPSFPRLLFFQAESCLFQPLLAQQLFHTSAPTLLVNFPGTVCSPCTSLEAGTPGHPSCTRSGHVVRQQHNNRAALFSFQNFLHFYFPS